MVRGCTRSSLVLWDMLWSLRSRDISDLLTRANQSAFTLATTPLAIGTLETQTKTPKLCYTSLGHAFNFLRGSGGFAISNSEESKDLKTQARSSYPESCVKRHGIRL